MACTCADENVEGRANDSFLSLHTRSRAAAAVFQVSSARISQGYKAHWVDSTHGGSLGCLEESITGHLQSKMLKFETFKRRHSWPHLPACDGAAV